MLPDVPLAGPTTEVYEGRQATLAGTSGARLVGAIYTEKAPSL